MNRKGLFAITLLSLVAILLATVSVASAQRRSRNRSDDDDSHTTKNGRELETFREIVKRVVPVTSGARIKLDPNEFGGVDLSRVGGTVIGQTKFGGIEVELEGDRWDGERLDVSTEFGGVTLRLPAGYSADLETGTSFGSVDVDFPISVQGRLGEMKRINTQLGAGGAPIRVITKFGGVSIKER